jgi:hypothetical protein
MGHVGGRGSAWACVACMDVRVEEVRREVQLRMANMRAWEAWAV